jgi:glycosyltransferase involved in cell wall biosynthesis
VSDGDASRKGDGATIPVALIIGQLTYGGAEGQLYELAKGLRAPWRPIVYCLSGSGEPYGAKLRAAGVAVRMIPAMAPMDLTRVVRLALWLRRDRIRVAHAFLFIASAYTYLATRPLSSVRLVAAARNCKPEPNRARRALMRRALGSADAVLANSAEMARFASLYYHAPSTRSHVVYNGVDLERFRPATPGRALVIGTIGRLESQKNLDGFMQAAAIVLARRPQARFRIVGTGSELERLRGVADARGLSAALQFEGTTDDTPGFLAGLDQFWLTSNWEGTPNVVLEAMAAGVPVIATRVGGTAEIVADRATGILVEKGDMEAVAQASLRLADDPALAGRMGAAARDLVARRFSIAAMVDGTENVYRTVLGEPRG